MQDTEKVIIMNLNEVNEYLGVTAQRGSRLGLERVRGLLSLINDPQNSLRVIHIAGTNGKGSVSAMLTQILKASGYKVGSFCSPALTDDRDSFLINGEPISEERFCEMIGFIKPYAESMKDKPTQFEVLAVCAYVYFAQEKCEAVLMECGMGGELDATNAIDDPLLSVITNVALDHTAFLGETVGKIAENKSGIIKKGRPVLFGGKDSSALSVIEKKAKSFSWKYLQRKVKFSKIHPINEMKA
jgi:dihydrofolate synthase/folylpolyglutamate synthase